MKQIQLVAGLLGTILMFSLLPIVYSFCLSIYKSARGNTCIKSKRNRYTKFEYNDLKQRIFLGATMRCMEGAIKIGGSLHAMYENNHGYRKIPMFSYRSSDCFVLCFTPSGRVNRQIRLSLLACLDMQLHDSKLAVSVCTESHKTAVSTINSISCEGTVSAWCLHPGQNNIQWIQ